MNSISRLLLVVGCQRSGTTLLAAMLGGHSEINMLAESNKKDVLHLIGKKYSGNKLILHRQIRMHQKPSKFGHLVNRIVNFDLTFKPKKFHTKRVYPISEFSIQDYIDRGAKTITIVRNEDEVIKSVTKRTNMTVSQAKYEYKCSLEIIENLKKYENTLHVKFSDLIHNTKETLISICKFLDLEFEERMLKGPEYNFIYPNKGILKEKSKVE
jgi:hypothetical protein